MSIEKTGPRGYDYQYLVTVYAALAAIASNNQIKTLYSEKPGSEDAELSISDQMGISYTYEIQVKSETGHFDSIDIGNILCHFPSQKSQNNLTERLLNDSDRHLLIVTKARTLDLLYSLVETTGSFIKAPKVIDQKLAESVLVTMGNFGSTAKSKLKIARASLCRAQVRQIKNLKQEQSLLSKIAIWECQGIEELHSQCEQILFRSLGVPQLQTTQLLVKLLLCIKEGRDSGLNIANDFHDLIEKYRIAHPKVPDIYVPRKEEQQLITHIEKNSSLFLTGSSFCGKTSTALSILKYLTQKGYDYKKYSRVEDAERFLIDTNVIDRVVLLDDPFGHYYDPITSDSSWFRVKQLIEQLTHGRKIIITSNSDILNRMPVAKNYGWHDLTNLDIDFTHKLLEAYFTKLNLTKEARQYLSAYVNNSHPTKLFQPGQLDYLLNNWDDSFIGSSKDLYQLAAIDATKLLPVLELKGTLCTKLYRILGFSSDVNTVIVEEDLAFILSDTDDYLPTIVKRRFSTINFTSQRTEPSDFPKYNIPYSIEPSYQTELDYLTKNGFIIYESGGYRFRHPYYQEAARLLIQSLELGEAKNLLPALKKAIGCLSVQTSLIATRSLSIVFKNDLPFIRQSIIELAFFAGGSIFPSVSDAALIFLSTHLRELDNEQAEKLQSLLSNYHFDSSSVRWHNGIPHRPIKSNDRYLDSFIDEFDEQDNIQLFSQLSDPMQPLPSAEQAWALVDHIKTKGLQKPMIVEWPILDRLLNYDEAFIRAIAAYQIFYQSSSPPIGAIKRALNDSHAFVALQAIKGFIHGWPYYKKATRQALLPLVLKRFVDEPVLIAGTHLITQFGIGYAHYSFDWLYHIPKRSKPKMWQLWSILIKLFFEHAPRNLRVNTGRFISTMRTSLDYLTDTEISELLLGWAKWILNSTIYRKWDDTLFTVNILYFEIFDKLDEESRLEFLNVFLYNDSDTFTADCLRLYTAFWDELLLSEKQRIKVLIEDHDPENILKAVVLTSKHCPEELSLQIVGNRGWQNMNGKERIRAIDRNLLEKCISIIYITHRYIGLSNQDKEKWNLILIEFLTKPSDVLSRLAIKTILNDIAYRSETNGSTKTKLKKWLVASIVDKDQREYVFDLMLEDLTETTCSTFEELWKVIFAHIDDGSKLKIRKMMAAFIERIEMHDNIEIVLNLFGNDFFNEIPADGAFLTVLVQFRKHLTPSPEILSSIKTMIESVEKHNDFRLRRSYELMLKFASDYFPNDSKLREIIDTARHEYFEREKAIENNELRDRVEAPFASLYIN